MVVETPDESPIPIDPSGSVQLLSSSKAARFVAEAFRPTIPVLEGGPPDG